MHISSDPSPSGSKTRVSPPFNFFFALAVFALVSACPVSDKEREVGSAAVVMDELTAVVAAAIPTADKLEASGALVDTI